MKRKVDKAVRTAKRNVLTAKIKRAEKAMKNYHDWIKSQFSDWETTIVFRCNICGQDVEVYTDENVLMQLDIIEELESHLTSEHDSNEWINYKELEEDNPLPYFDHKGKQITSEQYDKRYMD